MARMYSGKRGKSGSKKPVKITKKLWIRYSEKEVESIIVKLAKGGKTPSQIGLILRDSYGVPDVRALGIKGITEILGKNSLLTKVPEDLTSLIKKDIQLMKHLEQNKKDMDAKRGIILTESKIHRLVKYYKSKKVLPESWHYEKDKAKLLIS
ncbi:30S ribosomal protein S15 [Candidatus Woesearchaeota archaeon]|nr:30S ribosomal protein S15 [Candidatus Woesearchaeota archaeon]